MKRKLQLFAIAAIAAISSVGLFSSRTNGAATSSEGLSSPRSLFIQNCSRCHGSNGRAQTALGRKLEAADLTSGDVKGDSLSKIERVIRNGRPQMPAFGKKLTAQQISAIAGYVKSL